MIVRVIKPNEYDTTRRVLLEFDRVNSVKKMHPVYTLISSARRCNITFELPVDCYIEDYSEDEESEEQINDI